MKTLLLSFTYLVALPLIIDASRVSDRGALEIKDDVQAVANESRDETAVTPVSKWSFKIKKTLCAQLDFGNMKGIVEQHPKAMKHMQDQGTLLANTYGCRLCDLEGNEFTMGTVIHTVLVTCHAYAANMNDNLEQACMDGNGKPGWRKTQDPPNICLPCPPECEFCEKAGSSDVSYLNYKWFKCILPNDENRTAVRAPWKCEAVQDRRNNPGQFQWCQYRKNLVSTSTNGRVPEPSSTWQLTITAARCDKTLYEGKDVQISAMVETLTPKLFKLSNENCEICRVMVGASVASDPTTEVVIGESSSKAWVDTKCAFDEVGKAACRADRGKTGWAKIHKCAPCPHACASCEDRSAVFGNNKKFKCNLRYQDGAGDRLTGLMLGKAEVTDTTPAIPEGYDCTKPVKKRGQTGKGVFIGGYKTHCKYQHLSY